MAATYEPIASTTLASAAASYTFTSIPGTYTDLILVASVQLSTATGVLMQLNSDTATNYSMTKLSGTGGGVASNRDSTQARINAGPWYVGASTTGQFAVMRVQLQSYASTNVYKTALVEWADEKSTAGEVARTVGLWRSTAAISSLKVYPTSGNLNAGCVLALYAIKAA